MATTPIDLRDKESYNLAVRVGLAWRELRRGASMGKLRDYMFGGEQNALEQGQVDTLDLLAQQPSWRMSDLAEALRVDPSTATRAVQRLIAADLATRAVSDDDGRVVKVSITAEGRSLHSTVVRRRAEVLAHVLGSYDPAERVVVADLLERFVAAMDEFVAQITTTADE